MPSMNTAARLAEIPGMVPAPSKLGTGCSFAPRCTYASERCRRETPALAAQGGADHIVAWFEGERMASLPAPGVQA